MKTELANGKTVVAGESNGDFALARYTASGALDTSFSGDGKLTTDLGSTSDSAYSVTPLSSGKIIATGASFSETDGWHFAVARYTSNGSLDTSFGSAGKIETTIGDGPAIGSIIAVMEDGSVVVMGGATEQQFAAKRYTSAGAIDPSFGEPASIGEAQAASIETEGLAHAMDEISGTSGAPSITATGDATVIQDQEYSLTLHVDSLPEDQHVRQWIVDWADGTGPQTYFVDPLHPNADVISTHSYSAVQAYSILVWAQLDSLEVISDSNAHAITMQPHGVVTTPRISVNPIAQFDLEDNALIVTEQSYADVEALVINGFGDYSWSGSGGIMSSNAEAMASTDGSTAVGVLDNADLGYASIGDANMGIDDILVRYTWVADANCDGVVDNDDFAQFVYGYNGGDQRWLNGDFDYSGAVDSDDFGWFLTGLAAFNASSNTPKSVSGAAQWMDELFCEADSDVIVTANPPPTPENLVAVLDSENGVELSWTEPEGNQIGFTVERRRETGLWVRIAYVDVNETNYTDSAVSADTRYSYRIQAYTESAASGYSPVASVLTPVEEGDILVFRQDSTSPDAGWKVWDTEHGPAELIEPTPTSITPIGAIGGSSFLGQLGTGQNCAELFVDGVPDHAYLKAEFDLYIIKSWDGNNTVVGPDGWQMNVVHGIPDDSLIGTTFSNWFPFPQQYAPTDARDELGYGQDATYHISLTFPHADQDVDLTFISLGLQSLGDESWGITNFRLIIPQHPQFDLLQLTARETAHPTNSVVNDGELFLEKNIDGEVTLDVLGSPASLTGTRPSLWNIIGLDSNSIVESGYLYSTNAVTLTDEIDGSYKVLAGFDINSNEILDPYEILRTIRVELTDFIPTINIAATDAEADEDGPTQGQFTLTRDDTDGELTANYTISGPTDNGFDYDRLTGSATFPDGAASVTVRLMPIDDAGIEGDEDVVLTLTASTSYHVGADQSATVTIHDNDTLTGTTSPQILLSGRASSSTQVNLKWNDPYTGEAGWQLERSDDNLDTWQPVIGFSTDQPNVTSFTDTGLSPDTQYHYRVTALRPPFGARYSNVVTATTWTSDTAPPGQQPPNGGSGFGNPGGSGSIPPADPVSAPPGYPDGPPSDDPNFQQYYKVTITEPSGGDSDSESHLEVSEEWIQADSPEDAMNQAVSGYVFMSMEDEDYHNPDPQNNPGWHPSAEVHPYVDKAYHIPELKWNSSQLAYTGTITLQSDWDASGVGASDEHDVFDDGNYTVKVAPAWVDLDIDSDNDNNLDDPGRTNDEDKVEFGAGKSGKVIAVNDGDADADGLPDFADFTNLNEELVPIIVELPENVEISDALIKFSYDDSNPSVYDGAPPNSITPPTDGHLRLWFNTGLKYSSDLENQGDFISSGTEYAASDFDSPWNGWDGHTLKLWVEAVMPSAGIGDLPIKVEIDPKGDGNWAANDDVQLTSVSLHLEADTNYDAKVEPSDHRFNTKRGVIAVSNQDNVYSDTEQPAKRRPVDIRLAGPGGLNNSIELTRLSGGFKVFDAATEGHEITFNGTDNVFATVPLKHLWIEGDSTASTEQAKDKLVVGMKDTAPHADRMGVTSLWVQIEERGFDAPAIDGSGVSGRFNGAPLGPLNNTISLGVQPDQTDPMLASGNIELVGVSSTSNLDFGQAITIGQKDNTPSPGLMIAQLGFIWERRATARLYLNGNAEPVPVTSDGFPTGSFPTNRPDDNLRPMQDDSPSLDANGRLIIVDTDRVTPASLSTGLNRNTMRANMLQWTTLTLADKASDADAAAAAERCSPKVKWSTKIDVIRNEHGTPANTADDTMDFPDAANNGTGENEVYLNTWKELTFNSAPPTVTSINPVALQRGNVVHVTISGTNFDPESLPTLHDSLGNVLDPVNGSVHRISATEMVCDFDLTDDLSGIDQGTGQIFVTNPDEREGHGSISIE